MSPSRGVARRVLPGLLLLLATGCEHYESLRALPAPVLRTHYLIDFEYYRDAARLLEASGYLLIFNPGSREVPLDVTVYFEDREPQRFQLTARAGATTWSSVTEWPVKPEGRAEHLSRHGIGSRIHYPVPIHLQECAKSLGYGPGSFPVTERLARRILSLPIYPELTEAEVAYVITTIRSFFRE